MAVALGSVIGWCLLASTLAVEPAVPWQAVEAPGGSDGVSFAVGGEGIPALLKSHAIFMSLAWVFFAPVGIIVARYWRDDWPEKKACGTAIWFQAHRVLQSFTVIFTLLGIFCVFAYSGIYDTQDTAPAVIWQAHPIIGLLVMCIIIVQPIMAVLRPAKDSRWRPYFKLSHMLLGRLACILAIFNIFVGLAMYQSSWVSYDWWNAVLGAFVIFHIVMEVILSCMIRKVPEESLSDVDETKRLLGTGGRRSWVRKILVGLYGVVSLSVIIAIIVSCSRTEV